MRIIGAQLEDEEALNRLQKMRPRPSNYIAWGTLEEITQIYKEGKAKDMIKRDSKWSLVTTNFAGQQFSQDLLTDSANIFTMTQDTCCLIQEKAGSINDIFHFQFFQ